MNHVKLREHILVAVVASVLLVSASGLTMGQMISFVDATKPGNNDNDNSPTLSQKTAANPGGSDSGEIGNGGIGIGSGSGSGGASDFTALDMQGSAT
ncbi:MAG: hypothetical protein ACRD8W_28145, partial [Nitrososphaeraceae archaeon]